MRRANLVNGAYLFVAQSLCLGSDGFEDGEVEIEIVRGSADRGAVERFADLLLRQLEIRLATNCLPVVPYGGVVFLDGALHSQLPQLYPLRLELDVEAAEDLYDFPELILGNILYLYEQARERKIRVVAVAKTSREATHCKLWQAEVGMNVPTTLPDSEMIHRWTNGVPEVHNDLSGHFKGGHVSADADSKMWGQRLAAYAPIKPTNVVDWAVSLIRPGAQGKDFPGEPDYLRLQTPAQMIIHSGRQGILRLVDYVGSGGQPFQDQSGIELRIFLEPLKYAPVRKDPFEIEGTNYVAGNGSGWAPEQALAAIREWPIDQ